MGGAGEVVHLSGTKHRMLSVTTDDTGRVHIIRHTNPQGVSGVGLTSGDQYRATGVSQRHRNLLGPLPIQLTFVDSFNVIGPGPGNNFLVHVTTHVTINANGEETVNDTKFSIECK